MYMNKLKSLKIFALASMLIIGFSIDASAQTGERGERGERGEKQGQRGERGQGQGGQRGGQFSSERMLKMMKDSLEITAEQETKLKKVAEDFKKKRESMRAEMQNVTDREERREIMMAAMQDYNKAVMAVLTPKQQEKYKKMQERRQNNVKNSDRDRKRGERDSNSRERSRSRER